MNTNSAQGADKTPAHIAYGLMAVSVVTALPILIAIIIAWLNRKRTLDPVLWAHFNWQVRTFWINLLMVIIGAILTPVLVGWLILFLNQIWLVYRVGAGWYCLLNDRAPF